MKVIATKEALLNVCQVAVKFSRNGVTGVNDRVCIKVVNGVPEFSATNLEVGMVYRLSAHPNNIDGGCVVPATRLVEIIAGMPDGALVLDRFYRDTPSEMFASPTLSVSPLNGYSQRATVRCDEANEYPSLLDVTDEWTPVGSPEDWAAYVQGVSIIAFAAADEDNRPILQGICAHGDMLSAANGYMLGQFPNSFAGESLPIIPKRALAVVNKAGGLFGDEGTLHVSPKSSLVVVTYPNGRILMQTIEGKFPDVQSLVKVDDPGYRWLQISADEAESIQTILISLRPAALERAGTLRIMQHDGKLVFAVGDVTPADVQDYLAGSNLAEGAAKSLSTANPLPFDGMGLGINVNYLLSSIKVAVEYGQAVRIGIKSSPAVTSPVYVQMPEIGTLFTIMPMSVR